MPGDRQQAGRRVYRTDGDDLGEGSAPARNRRVSGRTDRDVRRSRLLALVVLVAVAIVITLVGVAANGSALEGSQETPSTFKLLPVTTTATS